MKKIKLFLALLLHTVFVSAQTFSPTLFSPKGLAVVDDYAYFIDNNQLKRVNIDSAPYTVSTVQNNLRGYSSYMLGKSSFGLLIPNTGKKNIIGTYINSVINSNFSYVILSS